jgi:hypothetical protein
MWIVVGSGPHVWSLAWIESTQCCPVVGVLRLVRGLRSLPMYFALDSDIFVILFLVYTTSGRVSSWKLCEPWLTHLISFLDRLIPGWPSMILSALFLAPAHPSSLPLSSLSQKLECMQQQKMDEHWYGAPSKKQFNRVPNTFLDIWFNCAKFISYKGEPIKISITGEILMNS